MYLSANIGIENNNPGNIRYNPNINWKGQAGTKYGFVQFVSMPYGYRALIKNLQSYINGGTDTIEKIVYKWAPPGDGNNNPESYANNVSARTGISRNKKINAQDLGTLAKIAAAMSISEIGTSYPDAINGALSLLQSEGAGALLPGPTTTAKIWPQLIFYTAAGLIIYEALKPSENA
jgi:hypothetical protein